MAIITEYNLMSIIFNSDVLQVDQTSRDVYKKSIYIFNQYENASLLSVQELLEDPERWFDLVYVPRKTKDSYNYVYAEKRPSYHNNRNCQRLNSDYKNFTIPESIKEQGRDTIIEFRDWFKSVEYLYDSDIEAFAARLWAKWGIQTNPKAIERDNSGGIEIDNIDLSKIESLLDEKLKEAGRYHYQSPKNTEILKRYGRNAFLARKEDFNSDLNNYSTEEVKEFLIDYDEKFKKPLNEMLIQYYRVKYNPNIELEGTLLEQLGFKECGACSGESYSDKTKSKAIVDNQKNDLQDFDFEKHIKVHDDGLINFVLQRDVESIVIVAGDERIIKENIDFEMCYDSKSGKCWFVGKNNTPFNISDEMKEKLERFKNRDIIEFKLRRSVESTVIVEGEERQVKKPVDFDMRYDTKSGKCWFVDSNTPFNISEEMKEVVERERALNNDDLPF